MSDRIGQLFGNYRLARLLGQGGFADVYLGEQVYLNTQAAIKVLRTRLTDEDIVHFRNEARTIAHLEHPHIVQVLDFGVEGDIPFLVMMYAPKGSLRQRHPRGAPLPPELIVRYAKQIASALQFAHQQKLIHRDIKPENILLGRNDEVLLSDFGIALVTPSARAQSLFDQSKTSGLIGTVPYMAPEQIQGQPTLASDQYALAVVVYEWFCGMPPFTGMPMEIAVKHVTTLPPLLREKDPTIPADVEKVVLTALAKDPRQRFANVQAFATALEHAYQREPVPLLTPPSTPPLVMANIPGNIIHHGKMHPGYLTGETTQKASGILVGPSAQQVASDQRGSITPMFTPVQSVAYTGYGGEEQPGAASPCAFLSQYPSHAPSAASVHSADHGMMSSVGRPDEALQASQPENTAGFPPASSPRVPRRGHRALRIALVALALLLLVAGGAFGVLAYVNSLPTPTKALDAFCSALENKDLPTAYHQLSSKFQGRTSEALFAGFFADVATCTHGVPTQTGNMAMANLTTTASGQTATDQVTLVQDNTNAWKIDDDSNLSGLTRTLNTYCAALQSGDYATAYGQFSHRLQGKLSESQFTSFFPQPSSCSYTTLTLTTGGATASIITISNAGQSESDLANLVGDSSNTWKIDDLRNLPDKTLDAFCTALDQHDYQTAYNLTSTAFQGGYPESTFANDFSAVTSCTHDAASKSGSNVTANLTLGGTSGQTLPLAAFLNKDSTGAWKIDNLVNLPDQTLTTFCNAVQQGDYQTAYDQFSTGYQQQVSEQQFATAFSAVSTCTHDFPVQTGDYASAHMQLANSSGQTVNVLVTLVQDSNGNWKIDNLQQA